MQLTLWTSLFIQLLVSITSHHSHSSPTEGGLTNRVLLITVDGVRPQDLVTANQPLPEWSNLPGLFYGLPNRSSPEASIVEVKTGHSSNISLPNYQTLMAGSIQPCRDNQCGRIQVPTLFDALKSTLSSTPAVFASWQTIELAVSQNEVFDFLVVAGPQEADEPRPPWKKARWDQYTWKAGTEYHRQFRPQLLWISLDDSDEWGHQKNWEEYIASIRRYGQWFETLFKEIEMSDTAKDDRTTVIITTDHGRGATSTNWNRHGPGIPEASDIWLFVSTPEMRQPESNRDEYDPFRGRHSLSHLDLRPYIESLLQ